MKDQLLNNIEDPAFWEDAFRNKQQSFLSAFGELQKEQNDSLLVQAWSERLKSKNSGTSKKQNFTWGSKREWQWVFGLSLASFIIAKFPEFFSLNEEEFYSRNWSILVFPFLIAYRWLQHKWKTRSMIPSFTILCLLALFINLFPTDINSDVEFLVLVHFPILLWLTWGYTFVDRRYQDEILGAKFIQHNGELLILGGLLFLLGLLFSGLTVALFDLIGLDITKIYIEWIAFFGMLSIPLVASLILEHNVKLVQRITHILAKIFTPLLTILLGVFLVSTFFQGVNPRFDRDFLILFNGILIGVLALTFFSWTTGGHSSFTVNLHLILVVLALLVNLFALYGITFRLQEEGLTPNRVAVLGSNILLFGHLLLIGRQLWDARLFSADASSKVTRSIISYLPVYGLWALLIMLLFPFIF